MRRLSSSSGPATRNKIPPDMAVLDLLSGLASMKCVHFIPTVETNTASVERNMLNTMRALVTWSSAGTQEGSLVCLSVRLFGGGLQ